MTIEDRFSLSSCSCSALPWEEALALAERTGFHSFETFTTWTGCRLGPDVRSPESVRRDLERHGLQLSSLNLVNLSGPEVMERLADEIAYAADCGLSSANVKGGRRDQQDWDTLFPLVEAAAQMAAARGLTLNLGNHPGNRFETVDDYRRVFETLPAPNLRILLDSGHFYTAGATPFPILDEMPERVGLVHLNDRKDGQGVPMGTGQLELRRLLQRLDEIGYDGMLVFELESGDPLEAQEPAIHGAREYVLTVAR
jgi:sugar phosphate isomerase/epimerase